MLKIQKFHYCIVIVSLSRFSRPLLALSSFFEGLADVDSTARVGEYRFVTHQTAESDSRRYQIDNAKIEIEFAWMLLDIFDPGSGATVIWYFSYLEWFQQVFHSAGCSAVRNGILFSAAEMSAR